MPRQIDPALSAAFAGGHLRAFVMADLSFRSKTEYCWTGIGNIAYNGATYLGVGAFGRVGTVTEGTDIQADGTTIGLAGVNPELYQECLNDIQQGLPAKLYAGVLSDTGQIVAQPYMFFSGYVDKSTISIQPQSLTIVLNLENLMAELQRPPMTRLTSADQGELYPTDSAFSWTELLNDQALRWGH